MKKPIEGTIRVVKNKIGMQQIEVFFDGKFNKINYTHCSTCGRKLPKNRT